MAPTEVKNRIANLEAEVKLLKKAFVKRPNLSIDNINWEKIKPSVKKARVKLFRKVYG